MRVDAISLAVLFNIASGGAVAQDIGDPIEHLRTCSLMERAERLECLDRLSRNLAPAARTTPGGGNWIVSETTSPVDYKPIVTATTSSRIGSDGSSMQLSIHCRSSRTELVITGPAVSRAGGAYAVVYRINDGQPAQHAALPLSSGAGIALTGDVIRFLQSLPEEGEITIRLVTPAASPQEGHFLLGGMKMVRQRIAAACKWPNAVAKPRN